MKKGTVITRVEITNGDKVTAYARVKNGLEFTLPLTRVQRNLFLKWGKYGRYDEVRKEFGTDTLINEEHFKIVRI